jgi:hypothetical protein
MMLLGIYWFVVEDSRRKAAINVLFLLWHIYIYLLLSQKRGIMKATIYKGFTYVHCLVVVAGIGVEER